MPPSIPFKQTSGSLTQRVRKPVQKAWRSYESQQADYDQIPQHDLGHLQELPTKKIMGPGCGARLRGVATSLRSKSAVPGPIVSDLQSIGLGR